MNAADFAGSPAGTLVPADHRPRLYYAGELIAILEAPQAEETPD